MSKFVNHYETLNVASDASLETIRASYHALCKAFHPDLNPHMQDGLLMIEELTNSYEVLKDVNARQDYDLKYLIEMRRNSVRNQTVAVKAAPAPVVEKLPALPSLPIEREMPVARDQKNDEFNEFKRRQAMAPKQDNGSKSKIASIAAMAILGVMCVGYSLTSQTSSKISLNLDQVISTSKYVRPALAPNGMAFPETSAYLAGYALSNNSGTSSLMVINSKNDNDVYLKLISLEGEKATTVRHVLIKGKTDFKIENLSTGKYEIQYLDLVAGLAGKSEVFTAEESKNEFGSKSSNLSVTLQTAVDGTLKVQSVSIEEFNSLASL